MVAKLSKVSTEKCDVMAERKYDKSTPILYTATSCLLYPALCDKTG